MPTIQVPINQVRPLDATPERALALWEAGMKQRELAQLWHISGGRVSQLIEKARINRARETADRQPQGE